MEEILLTWRMFATGEERLGERVKSYHKNKKIELIIDALELEELKFLRKSTCYFIKEFDKWFVWYCKVIHKETAVSRSKDRSKTCR
ncbi:unnamed protein product [Eruca vesicaria subsp. sativa]|uniref:Uncharacterized protein n=1 Tax=Eruca vesicaria subsp. sativa TaxID=29727 RepID=A0ABC8IX61_ERUVS|nr:unnamed protein product [Eruca vesicaria subsp. sativa]